MKKTILTALVTFGCLLHNLPAAVTFTGTAMVNSSTAGYPLGLAAGQVAIWLNKDNVTTSWNTLISNSAINSGGSLFSDSTYNASLFTVMGTTTASLGSLSGGVANIPLSNGTSTGDQYAVLIYNTSTSTTIAGDTYKIWRASDWLIPSEGSTFAYSGTPVAGSSYQQIKTADYLLGSGSVAIPVGIPEPSSVSLLALGMAGLVALRTRRKS